MDALERNWSKVSGIKTARAEPTDNPKLIGMVTMSSTSLGWSCYRRLGRSSGWHMAIDADVLRNVLLATLIRSVQIAEVTIVSARSPPRGPATHRSPWGQTQHSPASSCRFPQRWQLHAVEGRGHSGLMGAATLPSRPRDYRSSRPGSQTPPLTNLNIRTRNVEDDVDGCFSFTTMSSFLPGVQSSNDPGRNPDKLIFWPLSLEPATGRATVVAFFGRECSEVATHRQTPADRSAANVTRTARQTQGRP